MTCVVYFSIVCLNIKLFSAPFFVLSKYNNQRQSALKNYVIDRCLVLQLLCGAGYCMHAISVLLHTHISSTVQMQAESALSLFLQCACRKECAIQLELAFIETRSHWLHALRLHSRNTDAEEQLF